MEGAITFLCQKFPIDCKISKCPRNACPPYSVHPDQIVTNFIISYIPHLIYFSPLIGPTAKSRLHPIMTGKSPH